MEQQIAHFEESKKLISKIKPDQVAQWLLTNGYYPEQYVLPPCFKVGNEQLDHEPKFKCTIKNGIERIYIPEDNQPCNPEYVYLPKSQLLNREFGIYDFKIYHDIVYYIHSNWGKIVDIFTNEENIICSYSFPIPLNSTEIGDLGHLRAGRMIYEFIQMSEKDLLEQSYKYKYILKVDIKNFYQSIYSHSIAWAIDGKNTIRHGNNRTDHKFLGNKIDFLVQKGNDGCTNGILTGPAISDLISEIILARVDLEVSQVLRGKFNFIATRFKDDYRFLVEDESHAREILFALQKKLQLYKLVINEEKTVIKKLPNGIYRLWKLHYTPCKMTKDKKITFSEFECNFIKVSQLHIDYPNTGLIDKFLSQLYNDDYELVVSFNKKNLSKILSIFIHLKELRPKAFPQILALIESMYNNLCADEDIKTTIKLFSNEYFKKIKDHADENIYEFIWLLYFMKSNNLLDEVNQSLLQDINSESKLVRSIISGTQQFSLDFNLFQDVHDYSKDNCLLNHLHIFNKSLKDNA